VPATATSPATNATAPATAPASSTPAPAAAVQSGAALRNENVFASKLDTDAQKADDQRLGGSYVLVSQPAVEASYYASEYGQASSPLPVLNQPALLRAWHADLFEFLRNSVFNARTYFQVGPVQPSRLNTYGARFTGSLPRWGFLSGTFGQIKNRGVVNGNTLVPLPSERTPLATDPLVRPIVASYLDAFPVEAPNRPDIDPRALNRNAPQTTDAINGSLRLDGGVGARGQISLSHLLSRQTIHAFQLVAGKNPDTVIHSQESRLTYRYIASEATEVSFGAGYQRLRSDLHPEPHAVGTTVVFGNAVDYLGPTIQYPLNRAENTFRYGVVGYHRMAGGRHRLTFGGDLSRYQMNGLEQNAQRGIFMFTNNFGRDAIQNMLWGTPTSYQVRIGSLYRGFRSWTTNVFVADQWNITPDFQLYVGLRYNATTAPVEVNHLDTVPFHSDRNNFSPRFAFAYRAPKEWILRGSYTISYGQIFPVTYSQIRYNAPNVVTINVSNPYLPDPLAGVDVSAADARTTLTTFSPDLVAPYSHQYSLTVQHAFGPWTLDLGYFGSRSLKMLDFYLLNRAQDVPGIPLTTATVNQRRPDPRYYDVIDIVNGGIAYLDAARAAVRLREYRGLSLGGSYIFSKALDQGSTYNSVAANLELYNPSPYQYDSLNSQKAPSAFDSPHALILYSVYRIPRMAFSKTLARLAGGWEISANVLARAGTPFTVQTGSDAPGFGNVDGTGGDRPNIANSSILGATVGDPNTSTQILNPANFSFLSVGQSSGNLGRNTFRRASIFNINASVSREWKWGRSYLLRFQAEAYNLANHPQFDQPQNNLTSPSFGKITNTLNDGRVLQLGLRLSL
jgi:hypothetical protein